MRSALPLRFPLAGNRARAVAARWAAWPDALDTALSGVIALGLLALYDATLTPSLSYISPDGNELATIPYTLGLAHPTGYPLYTWLGKAFTYLPTGDVAHRVNLMSAVGAAAAGALLFVIVRAIGGSRPAAGVAAAAFGLSTTLWSQATISEVYAPNAAFVALEVLLLICWARRQDRPAVREQGDLGSLLLFAGWAFTFAASTGTHLSGLGFAPAFAVFILATNWRVVTQPWVLIPAVAVFVLGLMQFLWLPLRTVMGEPSPDPINPATIEGFRRYTIDAFPQFKWAFDREVLPDRFMVYGMMLRENFGWPGIGAGVAGAVGMAVFRPRVFLLLGGMWVVHVIFFMDYRAQDLDVFFIPAHLVFAAAIGFGAHSVGHGLGLLLARAGPHFRALTLNHAAAGQLLAAAAFAAPLVLGAPAAFADHDQSSHTEINDFYRNAFEILPEGAALLGAGGVFGYDAFYYPMVYGVRPDVVLPAATLGARQPRAVTEGRAQFSVDGPGFGGRDFRTPGAEWYVPVLVAPAHEVAGAFLRRNLILYHLSSTAPVLEAGDPTPGHPGGLANGGTTFIGADLGSTVVERGGRVTIRLYWRLDGAPSGPASLAVGSGDAPTASHEVGFGMLERYSREVADVRGKVIVEAFELVVLTSTPTGAQPLRLAAAGSEVTIATLEVK